jgi:Xaa-Pro aminopeptidase
VPDLLIHGDTVRSPELRHEVPVPIPDAFLYAEKGDRRVVILHSLEIPRVREEAPQLEIVPLEQLGTDELFAQGKQAWEIELEVAARACRELGIEHATVPPSFPVAHADHLRANGIEIAVGLTSSATAGARRTKPSSRASAGRSAPARRRSTPRACSSARRSRTAPGSKSRVSP